MGGVTHVLCNEWWCGAEDERGRKRHGTSLAPPSVEGGDERACVALVTGGGADTATRIRTYEGDDWELSWYWALACGVNGGRYGGGS